MQVVTGAMSTLLPKLANLLVEEYKLQSNTKGEIMFLMAELESMEAALLKVSEAPLDQPPDIQVKLWAREVRELSYDIEDSIDTFMVHLGARNPKNLTGLKAFVNRGMTLLTKAKIRHNIGADIQDIKKRIKEVSERRDRYRVDIVDARPVAPAVDSLRLLSALYDDATELVGTKKKSSALIKMLEVDDVSKKKMKVVSIVGFGGTGKTTLAKIVYEKIRVQFDCAAFVHVNHNPNVVHILKSMLDQLGCGNYKEILDQAQLINKLRDFLEEKRYFIIIDDIWKKSVWSTIQYALIRNECRSRVITTTRILSVGQQSDAVYKLQPLSPSSSRKLFYARIFGTEGKCHHNQLAKVGENILRKCGGVPLAIITIASMLANNKGKETTCAYWSKVYQCMGSGLEDNPSVKDMRRILSVSYYDLPPHLKSCMLYVSSYPKDNEIKVEDLIWKWVGEGFIHKEQGKSMYEVGENYVDELVNRSMIQHTYIDHDISKERYCRVSAMVLDLITFLSKEDHFLTSIDDQRPVYLPNKIRRLSLQTHIEADLKDQLSFSMLHVRSLTMSVFAINLLPTRSSFISLRALDLSGCEEVDNHHFKAFCNLLNLRYLGLSSTSITRIPKEIENLHFLQVLDIRGTVIEELPSAIIQLRSLVCLRVDSLKGTQSGFRNLKNLQELADFIFVKSPTMLHDLGELIDLRRLTLYFQHWDERYELPFLTCLSSLVSLEYLEIYECIGDLGSRCQSLSPGPQQLRTVDMTCCPICTVPRWMPSLSSLSVIHMRLQTIGEEDLQVLGSVPSLMCLSIWVEKPTQGRHQRLVIGKDCAFYCLRELKIYNMVEVTFGQEALQKLQTLDLSFNVRQIVDQFGDFVFGLENLSSLKVVSVVMDCYNSTRSEVKDAKADIRNATAIYPNKPKLKLKSVSHYIENMHRQTRSRWLGA